MTSACRGEKRMTSAPKRELSKRLAAAAINSIAQHAKPIGMGQSELLRIQLIAASRRGANTSPSVLVLYASSVLAETIPARDVNIQPYHRQMPAQAAFLASSAS